MRNMNSKRIAGNLIVPLYPIRKTIPVNKVKISAIVNPKPPKVSIGLIKNSGSRYLRIDSSLIIKANFRSSYLPFLLL
jgi:hypothetical protein